MTPQERDLINGLFNRLGQLEGQPRDPEADRLIQEGLRLAPHAIYALVQTVLVQDEALKTANQHIEELQQAVGEAGEQGHASGGFLDSMRGALFGGSQRQSAGSVPTVGPRSGYAPPPQPPWGQPSYGGASSYGGPGGYAPPPSGGSSFLGTAAAAAAGLVGGSLLLGGIRSMLGGSGQGPFAGTFGALGGGQPVEVINEVNEYGGPADDQAWGGPDDAAGPDYAGGPDDGYDDTADAGGDDGDSSDDGGSDYA